MSAGEGLVCKFTGMSFTQHFKKALRFADMILGPGTVFMQTRNPAMVAQYMSAHSVA